MKFRKVGVLRLTFTQSESNVAFSMLYDETSPWLLPLPTLSALIIPDLLY